MQTVPGNSLKIFKNAPDKLQAEKEPKFLKNEPENEEFFIKIIRKAGESLLIEKYYR